MRPAYRSLHFALLLMNFLAPTARAESETRRSDPGPAIRVVARALARIVSPGHPEYERERKVGELKKQVDPETAQKLTEEYSKKVPRCYVSPAETIALLVRGHSVEKSFAFTESCHLNGKISLGMEIFRVDLTLKEAAPYYRIRFLMEYRGVTEKKTKLVRATVKIFDGELFAAENKYEPALEFLGDYAFIMDAKGELIDPGKGTIYVETANRKKVDRVFPLVLTVNE